MKKVYIVFESVKWDGETMLRAYEYKSDADAFEEMMNNDNTQPHLSYYVEEVDVF